MKPKTPLFGQQLFAFARRYWIGLGAVALLALVLLVGSPAWAAPVPSPVNQTVPKPTPTSTNDPVATATPLPDDGGDESSGSDSTESSQSGGNGQPVQQGDINNIIFAAPATNENTGSLPVYTAIISVATLNVREGPGTDFDILGSVVRDQEVTVLFRNADGSWWYICCVTESTTQGWISSQLAEPNFDRAQSAELIPEFGAEEPAGVVASASTTASSNVTTTASTQMQSGAQLPLELSVSSSPQFVWQGQQVDIAFKVSNPNDVAVTEVEVSDDLPAQLELISAAASAQGRVTQEETVNGTILIRIRWNNIPAGGSASATITARILPDVPDGAVIDNLAAVRGRNAEYAATAVSIGMPPVSIPTFQ